MGGVKQKATPPEGVGGWSPPLEGWRETHPRTKLESCATIVKQDTLVKWK
jgi:hypothetical protein